jgi:type IV secretion system protein VirB6
MIASCPSLNQGEGVISPLLLVVDCYVETLTANSFGALFGPGSGFTSALTVMLTLVVALYGYQLMFGRIALNIASALPKVALIGVVLTFATNWAAYQTMVYSLLTQGPAELAGRILGQTNAVSTQEATADVAARLDLVFMRLTEAAQAWEEAIPENDAAQNTSQGTQQGLAVGQATGSTNPSASDGAGAIQSLQGGSPESLGSKLLLASAILFVLASGGLLVIAKIFLGVLLSIGPVFIVLALFSATRGLFDGWLRTSLTFAMAPLIILILSTVTMTVLEDTVLELIMAQRSGVFELPPVLTIFIATLIFTGMMALVLRLSAGLTAGWVPSRSFSSIERIASLRSSNPLALPASSAFELSRTGATGMAAEKNPRMATLLAALNTASAPAPASGQAQLNLVATHAQQRTAIAPNAGLLSAQGGADTASTGRQLGQTYQNMARMARPARAGGWR